MVRTASSSCEWLLGPGPYILFLRDHKLGSNETPQPGRYDMFGSYGIRSGAVEYGTLRQYWGWPLERFVAEIQGVMP